MWPPFAVQAVEYELRVISLEAGSMGEVLAARSIAAADCLTCVQVSPTGQHVLLAYGRRSKQLSCLVSGEGSYEVWHTVLQVRQWVVREAVHYPVLCFCNRCCSCFAAVSS
jgi:activator-of-BECN1-regulated-autophagy protein 1